MPDPAPYKCSGCDAIITPKRRPSGNWNKFKFHSLACANKARHSPPETRFWDFVDKTDGCWVWRGSKTNGYRYGFFKKHGKVVQSHRYSWEMSFGAIPAGLKVLHRCDNPPCVNPSHLFLGTQKDNIHDMIRKGRQAAGKKNAA